MPNNESVAGSEEHAFVRFGPGLLCVLDASFALVQVSLDWARMLGWPDDELRSRNLLDLLHADTRASAKQALCGLIELPLTTAQFDARFETKSAGWTMLSFAFTKHERLLFGTAHARESFGHVGHNEPDRNGELRLRTLLDSMEEGVVIQNAFGAPISSNAAARRILQATSTHLADQNAFDPPLMPLVRRDGTTLPDTERPVSQVLRTGIAVVDRVMGLRMPSGETTWLSMNVSPLRETQESPNLGAVCTFRDISSHIRLQEELESSLANFRSLVASLPVGVAVSHGRTMRYANKALANILGYDRPSELEGKETLEVIHPDSEEDILQRYENFANGAHNPPGVLKCLRRDGSSIFVEITSLISTFEGKPAILAIIRDVTESTLAKSALERSEARLRSFLNLAPVGIFETLLDGRCVYANDRLVNMTGLSEADVLNEGWLRSVHPDDLSGLQAARVAARAAKTGLTCDVRFVHEGRMVYAEARSVPLTTGGVTAGYLGVLVDLSDLRAAQQAAMQSETSFRLLTERAPIGIGLRKGRTVLFANPALARICGYTAERDLVGKDVVSLFGPECRDRLIARIVDLANDGHYPSEVFRVVRPDGTDAQLEVDSIIIDFRGEPVTLSLVRDVTELERARAERDAAHAALLTSLTQKETLLKEIHHRVKNNLQVVASLLRLGRGYVRDADSLAIFDESTARVRSIALVHEKLYQSTDLDHIEMGEYLRGLVAELVRANTLSQRIAVEISVERILLNIDRCVPIGLIVNELISNALKHAFGDGSRRNPVIAVSFRESGDEYELTVLDNGVGFPLQEGREGSLGLRLVASLTRQLHGTHREEGRNGTAWRVSFPKRNDTE